MNMSFSFKPVFGLVMFVVWTISLVGQQSYGFAIQLDEVVPIPVDVAGPQPKEKPEDKDKDKEAAKPDAVIDTNDGPAEEKIGEQFAQLHLRDASIIGGDIKMASIDIKTEYGVLKVPISKVSKIMPGLNGNPELKNKITSLVKGLGDAELTIRDAAQRDLVAMGLKIKKVLNTYDDGGLAERGKRLEEIRTEFGEIAEELEEDLINPETPLDFNDTVVTPDFSIVGEIQQKEFEVSSKFGRLQVQLGDILVADRTINQSRPEVRKTVEVDAMAFFQTKPQSAGIRVHKGDKISIQASGVVQWTNWSNSSSPEGLTNRSTWNGINSGKLVARVGTDNSSCVAVGAKGEFVAKKSGTLYLGISMRDSYATSTSYTWTGNYKAKIKIAPGTE